MAQLVKHLTPDFCSGRDPEVREIESHIGLCAGGVEPAWDSLSPSPSAPLLLVHAGFLVLSFSKINK